MLLNISTHSRTVMESLAPYPVAFVLTEPLFSTRHPEIQSKAAFLDLLKFALNFNRPVYVSINGYLEPDELKPLKAWLRELSNTSIQGFILADLAVKVLLEEIGSPKETVFAPETILTNRLDIQVYLERFDRIILARELTLKEITEITRAFPGRIEIFGLGHWLLSSSKRPFVRDYLQAIGHPAEILNRTDLSLRELKRTGWLPILEEDRGTSVFSEGILYPLEELETLEEAGCAGLHLDQLFIEENDFICLVKSLLDLTELDPELKSRLPLAKAYFNRKTNLSKEDGK